MIKRVDNFGISPLGVLRDIHAVVSMDMPMNKIRRLISVDQFHEALKALVGGGIYIVDMAGGGVGEKDIKTVVSPQLRFQLPNSAAHLIFRIHIFAISIAVGTSQSQNPHPLADNNAIFGTNAALWRPLGIAVIMVSPDVDHRTAGQGDKELQIALPQITTGQDQVKLIQPSRLIVFIVVRGRDIPHSQ